MRADFPHPVLAAVDLGSNSFRLQISRVVDGQLFTLDSLKETTRLGAGLGPDKVLDEASVGRALACFARFGERLRGLEGAQVRVVGTNTLRVARNAPELIAEGERLLGFPIEIIAGREEARLIYLGAAHSLPNTRERRLVVDIGGGSTELIVGSHFQAHVTESLPLGCVSYTLRFFEGGRIDSASFNRAVYAARAELQRVAHVFPRTSWELGVGTSGTARSIRDLLELNDWSAGNITYGGMRELRNALIRIGRIDKISLNGLKADRAPVICGGLAVMLAVFEELGVDAMTIADGALRDGVLYDILGRGRERDQREQTVATFTRRYHADPAQAARVKALALDFYRQLAGEDCQVLTLRRLGWAAALHEIGLSIAHTAYHKHSAYILQNADMPGFSRPEQAALSTLVLCQRGDSGKMRDFAQQPDLWYSVLALRMAVLFCRSRRPLALPAGAVLFAQPRGVRFELPAAWLEENPLTASALEQEAVQWRRIGLKLALDVRQADD
ncbi:Ppx/GppA phosphatase family protein [Crenobacter intestini]|uniref:Ppx/GppA phosphatase family protein n=1 Tax=Crenobacter intestini TaxID=2563443 RepID=UPI00196AB4AD|nr:Ppx/GppA phosphatase family protein [Crenobacter intestini]